MPRRNPRRPSKGKSQLCKILLESNPKTETQKLVYKSDIAKSTSLENIIQTDKSYGFLTPDSDKILRVALKNTDDEITYSDAKKAVIDGFFRWELETDINFIFENFNFASADIRIEFRTEAEDPELTSNTIAYMYYPFTANNLRGVMIINKRFIFSNNGELISGRDLIKKGIPVQFPDGQYITIDLDKIIAHELGHGVYGLPHDPEANNVMASTEGKMSEQLSTRDVTRGVAKAGKNSRSAKVLAFLRKWFFSGAHER